MRTCSAVEPLASQPAPDSAVVNVIANGAAANVTSNHTRITARRCRAIVAARRENNARSSGSGDGSCSTGNVKSGMVLTDRLLAPAKR